MTPSLLPASWPRHPALLLLAMTCAATPALAGSRARFGGDLRVVVAGAPTQEDPLLADTPADAAISYLGAPPLCRLDANLRAEPLLVDDVARLGANRLRLSFGGRSTAPTPAAVAERWERLSRTTSLSPYRALLFAIRGEGRQLQDSVSSGALDLSLTFPWPDLERALCHPALGIPGNSGAFLGNRARTQYLANPGFVQGRPYLNRINVSVSSDRDAARALALNQAEVVLGASDEGTPVPPPALYATYLAFRPSRAGSDLRRVVEASIDRTDLTRYFVRGPAVAMSALLPPALMPQPTLTRPATLAPANRDVTLLYDVALDDQRAVAERLQVRLHDQGYRVSLRPAPRDELRRLWARGDFDLMLHGVLLPAIPGPALSVVIDLAGRHDLLATELPPIGAIADATARDLFVRQRAEALREQLPVIPLYAQSLSVRAAPRVSALAFDAQGLPILDDVFLAP